MNDAPTTDMAEHEAPRESAARNWPLTIGKWLAIVVGALIALIALALFLLNTGPGHRFIADQIAALEFENGMQIDIGRIEGSIYSAMTLHDVSVSDPKGEFVTSPAIQLDWRPFAYLDNVIDIRSLTAGTITLLRLPEFNETPPSDDPLLPDLDIDVDRLAIDRFVVEAPVSGTRRIASLAGEVHIADRRAQARLEGATLAAAGNPGGDRIALRLDAVPEENRLGLNLFVNAPSDGVINAFAGLNQELRVRLAGEGDWANWNGRLQAMVGGANFADLDLGARNGTVSVKGQTRIARLFEGVTAQLLGPVTDLDLVASLEERVADLSGTVTSDALRLNANGAIDLSDNTFGDLRVAFVLLRPSALTENLRGSGLRGQIVLDGAFGTPDVAYMVNANRLLVSDIGLQDLRAEGAAQVRADQILVPVDARVRRIVGLDTVAGGTLTNVRLNGDLAIAGTRILSDNIRLRSDRIDAGLIVVADTSTGLYTGAVDGRIDNYRIESVGIFNIETDVDLETVAGGGFALDGRVRARSTSLANESVRDFLGGNAVAAADIRYGTDGTVRFTNLSLNAPAARITGGSGSYAPNGQLTLNADGVTDAYGRVGVRVAGTISNPRAFVTAERPNLGIGLANLEAEITSAANGYRLNATGDTDYGALVADVVLGTGPQLTLDINNANLGGIDFAGSLRQTAPGPFAGRLTADGQGLSGVVRLDGRGQYQEALVNLRARDTVLPGPLDVRIEAGRVDARVILYDQPYVVADVALNRARYGNLDINAARAKVDYRGGRGSARVLAEGDSGIPFRIAANADLQPDLWRLALNGRARGVAFRTAGPARIVPGDGSYRLLPSRISIGDGSVRLAGTYGDGLRIQSRLDALDLELVNAFVPGLGLDGTATGSLDFSQPTSASFPRADARLRIDDFSRTTAALVSQPVDINFVGKLLPDGGEARAVLRRRGSVIGRMVASLRPLPPGAGPWTERLLSAPLAGGIRYNGPAATLFSFSGISDQRLSGPIGVAADFSGRVQNPQLSGIVRANKLVYENLIYGTRLSDMALQGRFEGDQLTIERLEAVAGEGTVSAQGAISLSSARGYPMDLAIALDNARLARSEMIETRADGRLRLTKVAGEDALLAGNLVLPETRYEIIRQGAAEIPELTGVRFKPPKGPARITGDEPAEPTEGLLAQVRLAIDLTARDELYVSGMGLESEWGANLQLRGTNADPQLVGQVELIRGTLGFAGRSFELVEGLIDFNGGPEINPRLDLSATETIEEVLVRVNITGRAFDPQIAFTSTPGLPQDEIVSRILFGSSIGNLSAIQAVQLASSLNSLSGSGGGLNPLGKLRSATGIDRLRILGSDEASGRGTALAAGQYITDDIYVEFITDAKGFTATQLEIALTPALSILTQAGGSGQTNLNLRYRKNY